MRLRYRAVEDDDLDRLQVYSQQWQSRAVLIARRLSVKTPSYVFLGQKSTVEKEDRRRKFRDFRIVKEIKGTKDLYSSPQTALLLVAMETVFTSSHSEQRS